jgi:hypothetical protein
MFTRNFEVLEMVTMAGCRISASSHKNTIEEHDPSLKALLPTNALY